MIQGSAQEFYVIEFSEKHDPERVLCFSRNCTVEQRENSLGYLIYGWAIFKIKSGLKVPTGNITKTEREAKDIVDNWLRIDYRRAANAAMRAVHKVNRLARLTGEKQMSNTESTSAEIKEVVPYIWEIDEADRIFAHGLGVQL
jgi:hypothetical protein